MNKLQKFAENASKDIEKNYDSLFNISISSDKENNKYDEVSKLTNEIFDKTSQVATELQMILIENKIDYKSIEGLSKKNVDKMLDSVIKVNQPII